MAVFYDRANRMTTAVQGANNYAFAYNGLGDRLRQTVNAVPTNYRLDLQAGLTQVLSDGTNTYPYGLTRVGEKQPGGWQYHLGDALGSVRQLTNPTASVGLARSYQPFGTTMVSSGAASSVYQFTGEQRDGTGLSYLRARYYESQSGRFLQRDPISAIPTRPGSGANWAYAGNNPVNFTDPTGLRRYRIWASAFIYWPVLPFVHVYDPHYDDSTYDERIYGFIPTGTVMPALHVGDGRGFYDGDGTRRGARVWHEVVIETNPWLDPEVRSSTDTGWSEVSFVNTIVVGNLPVPVGWGFATAKAPRPSEAQIHRDESGCVISVEIDLISSPASGQNPLEPPAATPPIKYQYTLEFDICDGQLRFSGLRGWFPWHELTVDGLSPLVRFSPSLPFPTELYRPPQEVTGAPLELPIDEFQFVCRPS